ncbi:hypothetical protein [uncultured Ilyobacter sp.]|jgi:hypothetical protein
MADVKYYFTSYTGNIILYIYIFIQTTVYKNLKGETPKILKVDVFL